VGRRKGGFGEELRKRDGEELGINLEELIE